MGPNISPDPRPPCSRINGRPVPCVSMYMCRPLTSAYSPSPADTLVQVVVIAWVLRLSDVYDTHQEVSSSGDMDRSDHRDHAVRRGPRGGEGVLHRGLRAAHPLPGRGVVRVRL